MTEKEKIISIKQNTNFFNSLKESEKKELNKLFETEVKPFKKEKLIETLKLLNTAFTLNKNVKTKAYSEEFFDRCGRCGTPKDDNLLVPPCCPWSEWRDCYFSTTVVDYNLRDKEYSQKTKLLITVINNIKKYNLPIKYGKNRNILYFEYSGVQVSFHDPEYIINCKSFPGRWTRVQNKKIPFFWL